MEDGEGSDEAGDEGLLSLLSLLLYRDDDAKEGDAEMVVVEDEVMAWARNSSKSLTCGAIW